MRKGVLIRDRVYLILKNPWGPNTDVAFTAPRGTPIEWDEVGTNTGHEDHYGDVSLYWIDIPIVGHGIGAELGKDFQWTEEKDD